VRGRIGSMLRKEFLQVLRDPRMQRILFIMPVVQLVIFGYAANTDIRHAALAVRDLDSSASSRELLARLVRSGSFDAVAFPEDDREVRDLLDRGAVRAVVQVDRGFEEDLRAGRTAAVQLLVDGTDSNTARVILDYGSRIVRSFSRELQAGEARLQGAARLPGGLDLESRAWFNENLESRNFYVPGVIALIVMLITLMLTGMAIVREKEIGTMEQILVTPITPVEFILGKSAPFAIIAFVDVLLISAVGVLWFDVPVRGSLVLLLGATGLYLMTTIGIGLIISTVSQTQQQAMMTTFFVYFPFMLLSGFMFPIANMPEVIQWFTYINPLRYFVVVLRGVFLKGVGMDVLWPQLGALAILGVATLTVAVRRFHKTLS